MYLLTNRKEECTGCSACMNICPKNAIEMVEDEEGFLYPSINKNKCINCKLCENVCPNNNSKNNEILEAYGLKLKNIEERKASSSGGAFVAISDYILKQGGIVYGAGFDENLNVMHKRAESSKQRDEFKKSKYVQSDLKDIFKQVKNDLLSDKIVLFTGTPCQVDGVKKYLSNIDTNKLYTCDLVCHGVPSPKVYRDYLNYISNDGKKKVISFNFRNKKYGWGSHYETYSLKDGKEHTELKYRELFYSNLVLRPSCYECKYSNLSRASDITMADFWGIENINKEFRDNNGVSLFIINSEKGKKVFENIKGYTDYIKINIHDALQRNLILPTEKPKNRDEFWQDYKMKDFLYILKKYVPKIYDKNINKTKWFIYKVIKKIKSLIVKNTKQEMKKK